eukprot:4927676-Pyramimonas_sp.AAC.1
MHGSARYDAAPPPPPRRLTTAHRKPQPTTSDYDLRGHWIGVTTFGLTWLAIGRVVGHVRGGNESSTTGPHWNPAGQVAFRECPRGTCLDQRDRRQRDALPASCSRAA